MAHQLPSLPYDFAALEPHIDAQTMQIHHGKHHQAYVNNLNAAIEKHPELGSKSRRGTRRRTSARFPKTSEPPCATTAAGTLNHSLFWKWMAPGAGGAPTGALADAIASAFGELRRLQGSVRQGRCRPVRQRLGVARRHRREAVD